MSGKFEINEDADVVLNNIKSRRSIRAYKPDPVSDEAVETIIDAARWAPSAHNFQPTEFVVIRDEATRKYISEIAGGAVKRLYGKMTIGELKAVALTLPDHLQKEERILQISSGKSIKYILAAPVVIVVCVDMRSPYFEADGWMAVENLLLAAKALGLGTVATARGVVKPEDKAMIRERLSVPDGYDIIGIVPVGYPDEEPIVIKRDLDELIHYERFGDHEKP